MAYGGFDSLAYPDAAATGTMRWLKQNTNFAFAGYYLAPAPARPDSQWMGKRAALAGQGWGFAPVYVGQQEADHPGTHVLTAAQGGLDAAAAAHLMQGEGFAAGSFVYLDCEEGGAASAATIAYVAAWYDAVITDGRFAPGLYCSYTTAASLLAVRPFARLWVWKLRDPPPTAPDRPARDPNGSSVAQATIWQYGQNRPIAFPGSPAPHLTLDLDCSSLADPSAPIVPPAAAIA
jgi:hypothetical protein